MEKADSVGQLGVVGCDEELLPDQPDLAQQKYNHVNVVLRWNSLQWALPLLLLVLLQGLLLVLL